MDNSGTAACVWESVSLASLPEVAVQLAAQSESQTLWTLEGPMGAGKTTLIKALCAHWGVIDVVNSPTFGLVNEYHTESGDIIYHFDFYRMERPEEALEIGVEEYFDSGHVCLMEWPVKIGRYLPASHFSVSLSPIGADTRRIQCTHHE